MQLVHGKAGSATPPPNVPPPVVEAATGCDQHARSDPARRTAAATGLHWGSPIHLSISCLPAKPSAPPAPGDYRFLLNVRLVPAFTLSLLRASWHPTRIDGDGASVSGARQGVDHPVPVE